MACDCRSDGSFTSRGPFRLGLNYLVFSGMVLYRSTAIIISAVRTLLYSVVGPSFQQRRDAESLAIIDAIELLSTAFKRTFAVF